MHGIENSPRRCGLTCDSVAERQVDAAPFNNRLQNQFDREFRYQRSQRSQSRIPRRNSRHSQPDQDNANAVSEPCCNKIELACVLDSNIVNQSKTLLLNAKNVNKSILKYWF